MELETSTPEKEPRSLRKVLMGFGLILMGIAFGYFFIYSKLQAMKQQQEITYSMKGVFITPLLIVFGLYVAIFTPSGNGAWKDLTRKEKPYFVCAIVLSMLACFAVSFWFEGQMKVYGYK